MRIFFRSASNQVVTIGHAAVLHLASNADVVSHSLLVVVVNIVHVDSLHFKGVGGHLQSNIRRLISADIHGGVGANGLGAQAIVLPFVAELEAQTILAGLQVREHVVAGVAVVVGARRGGQGATSGGDDVLAVGADGLLAGLGIGNHPVAAVGGNAVLVCRARFAAGRASRTREHSHLTVTIHWQAVLVEQLNSHVVNAWIVRFAVAVKVLEVLRIVEGIAVCINTAQQLAPILGGLVSGRTVGGVVLLAVHVGVKPHVIANIAAVFWTTHIGARH